MSLMAHMLSCMLPKSIIIAYNTDSFTIIHPRKEAIADALEITNHKDDFDHMGKLKIEDKIKCSKGWGFACKRRKADQIPFLQERHPVKVYNRNDNIKDITDSFLINAKLAGSGKTWMLVSLLNNETDIMLLPTHEALQNVLLTAEKQGVKISEDRIKVIAN